VFRIPLPCSRYLSLFHSSFHLAAWGLKFHCFPSFPLQHASTSPQVLITSPAFLRSAPWSTTIPFNKDCPTDGEALCVGVPPPFKTSVDFFSVKSFEAPLVLCSARDSPFGPSAPPYFCWCSSRSRNPRKRFRHFRAFGPPRRGSYRLV